MIQTETHKALLITVLRAIYTDPILRNALGFKGGTAAMLFFELPRFSVDLDFDLLDLDKQEVFTKLQSLLPRFASITDMTVKRNTIFFLLSYQKGERNMKVEVSLRPTKAIFTPKNYLGISMLVMDKEDMIASKLSAVVTRKKFASRDLFDLWFFLSNRWKIREEIVTEKTGKSLIQTLNEARKKISLTKDIEMLSGLGELLDSKQKSWVKEKLKGELLFQIDLYLSLISV